VSRDDCPRLYWAWSNAERNRSTIRSRFTLPLHRIPQDPRLGRTLQKKTGTVVPVTDKD
jgi:hypothetical protein